MSIVTKSYVYIGAVDIAATLFIYFITIGTPLVLVSIGPTVIMLGVFLPIFRTINQINRQIEKQNGICYNCNLRIVDKDQAVLEDNNKVYCNDCSHKLFGDQYYQEGGIWYRKDSKTKSQDGNQEKKD